MVFKVHAFILIFLLFLNSCGGKSGSSSSSASSTGSGAGDGTVAGMLLTSLSTRLIAGGLSKRQANAVVNHTNQRLLEAGGDKNLPKNSPFYKKWFFKLKSLDRNDLSSVAPLVISGAEAALGDATLGITSSEDKLLAGRYIIDGVFHGLEGQAEDLSAKKRKTLISDITEAAIASVTETGVSTEDTGAMVQSITEGAVSSLLSTGVTSSEALTLFKEIVTTVVSSLDEAGFGVETMPDVLLDLSSAAIAMLGESGLTGEELLMVIPEMSEGFVEGLSDAGIEASDIPSMMSSITAGIVSNLDDAGIELQDMGGILSDVSGGTMRGLGTLELSADQMDSAMYEFMTGSVGAMGEAGLAPEEMASLIQDLTEGAVAGFDDAGLLDESDSAILEHLKFMTQGATEGLALYAYEGERLGSDYFDNVLSTLAVGAYNGLSESGLPEDFFESCNEAILEGSSDGLDSLATDFALPPTLTEEISQAMLGAMSDPENYYDPYAGAIEGEVTSGEGGIANLAAPDSISVTAGDHLAEISWSDVSGADHYNLYFSTDENVDLMSPSFSNVTSPFTHSDLMPGQTLYYTVVAFDDQNRPGSIGDRVDVTVLGTGGVAVPESPQNFSASVTASTISLSWDTVTGATSYKIYWKANSYAAPGIEGVNIISNITDTTYNFVGSGTLSTSAIYYLTVVAVNSAGASVPADELTTGLAGALPSAPSNLSLAADTEAQALVLDWQGDSDALYFNVYWGTSANVTKESGTKIEQVWPPYNFVADGELTVSQSYTFLVTAVNGAGESEVSDALSGSLNSAVSLDSLKKRKASLKKWHRILEIRRLKQR